MEFMVRQMFREDGLCLAADSAEAKVGQVQGKETLFLTGVFDTAWK